ncbi:RING/U-box superfamily protein [Actinidia rufa]|uniref:RING/U-box superfamily protein n=1 Tax=Actinidia rufa TaxID=165716 RepID=A0A7J0E343_9ERIC|nr:RING/U-box superfamily protein [Actinidia rufa]
MNWVFSEIKEQGSLSPPPPPASFQNNGFDFSTKVSPSILLIIIILAIIFFLCGLLHLLVRFLLSPQSRDPNELETVSAFQGQLQELFHLHDAGVDQSFIETLPIFNYKAIIASLLSDFPPNGCFSPIVLVLESGSESARENAPERDGVLGCSNSVPRANSHLGFHFEDELGQTHIDFLQKSCEIRPKDDEIEEKIVGSEEKVMFVKLGKFRNVEGEGEVEVEGSSNNNVDSRRCFSMGSFAYVMDENLSLQVPIRTPMKKQSSKKASQRLAMSECGCDSRRDFNGFEDSGSIGQKRKSPIGRPQSRRDGLFSFRFPFQQEVAAGGDGDDLKGKSGRWENGGVSENLGCDEENQSFNGLDSQPKAPSFARRTLHWLVGKQNKVVHSSFSSNP